MIEADVIQPSASIASTGPGIRYIGQHAYAYSGAQSMSTTEQTALSFTSGSGYIVGDFFFTGGTAGGNPGGGITTFEVTFNDVRVMWPKVETGLEQSPTYAKCNILIPPFTLVNVIVDSNVDAGALLTTVSLTGRVYGAD